MFLSDKIEKISRNRIINLIKEKIFFNNIVVTAQSYILKNEGQIVIKLPKPKQSKILPKKMNLDIIYEDKSLIVVNKESRVSGSSRAGNFENTLLTVYFIIAKGSYPV